MKDYPDDTQARIFLSSAVRDGYTDDGEPKKGTQESIAILQEVLKTAPNDSAANHYWIHAVESGSHPELALNSSAVLASLAPASGHMVHMPGHIYYRVGDYAQAEHWFAQSTAVDEKYMRDQHVDVDDDWNYVHNLMYGIANLMEQGKLSEATTLSAQAVRGSWAVQRNALHELTTRRHHPDRSKPSRGDAHRELASRIGPAAIRPTAAEARKSQLSRGSVEAVRDRHAGCTDRRPCGCASQLDRIRRRVMAHVAAGEGHA